MDMLVKGMIHVPGRKERDGMRFHHATQNSMQFYELFVFQNLAPRYPKHQKRWPNKASGVLLARY